MEYDEIVCGGVGPDDDVESNNESIRVKRRALPVARCGDCLYWKENTVSPKLPSGCQRYAPRIEAEHLDDFPWAITRPFDWCGEFIHRELGPKFKGVWCDHKPGKGYHPVDCMASEHQHLAQQWRFPTEPE